jgi:hypothetical protein
MSRLVRFLLTATLLTAAALVHASVATARPAAAADSCVIIDTDFDIDDLMSIPTVLGARHVAAIVTTEGYTLAPIGASAISRLVAEPGQRAIPVIVGAATGVPVAEIAATIGSYVLDYRALMGRLNNFLPTDSRTPPHRTTTCSRSSTLSRVVLGWTCWCSAPSPRS